MRVLIEVSPLREWYYPYLSRLEDARSRRQHAVRIEVTLGADQLPPERMEVLLPIVRGHGDRANGVVLAAQGAGALKETPVSGEHCTIWTMSATEPGSSTAMG